MRKIILYLQISLDGVVSDPEERMLFNDEILEEAIEYYKTLDTVILGSKTYPSMAEYWQKAEEFPNSDIEKTFAQKINQINKIVLSRLSVNLSWQNSKLLNYTDTESLKEIINQ